MTGLDFGSSTGLAARARRFVFVASGAALGRGDDEVDVREEDDDDEDAGREGDGEDEDDVVGVEVEAAEDSVLGERSPTLPRPGRDRRLFEAEVGETSAADGTEEGEDEASVATGAGTAAGAVAGAGVGVEVAAVFCCFAGRAGEDWGLSPLRAFPPRPRPRAPRLSCSVRSASLERV